MSESWDPVDFLVAIEKVDPLVDLEDASFVEHVCSKHGVNSLSKHGYTVLMYAAGHRCGFPVVQYLLAKYAKELDMEVTSPSMLYVFEWNEEYFFAGKQSEHEDYDIEEFDSGFTALGLAAICGLPSSCNALLEHSSPANVKALTKEWRSIPQLAGFRFDGEKTADTLRSLFLKHTRKQTEKVEEKQVLEKMKVESPLSHVEAAADESDQSEDELEKIVDIGDTRLGQLLADAVRAARADSPAAIAALKRLLQDTLDGLS